MAAAKVSSRCQSIDHLVVCIMAGCLVMVQHIEHKASWEKNA